MTAALRRKIECCKDCPKRHAGCHATCEDYKREIEELDELRTVIRAEKNASNIYGEFRYDTKKKRRPKNSVFSNKGKTKR